MRWAANKSEQKEVIHGGSSVEKLRAFQAAKISQSNYNYILIYTSTLPDRSAHKADNFRK